MNRCDCPMAEVYGDGQVYCGYYDIACMLCFENEHCPEEEEEENEELFEDLYLTDYETEDC
jgi:hypothetical protein